MKERRDGGRPRMPEGEQRNVVLSFVATKVEADRIQLKAIRARLSVSQLLRNNLGNLLSLEIKSETP